MGNVYSRNEVLQATLEYFSGDTLACDVWMSKYALRDKDDNYLELTPKDMHQRLAREFARIEKKYANPLSEKEIFELLNDWCIVPQGSPMSAIGNPYKVQSLSNCFVIESPADSYAGICKTDQEQVQIMKRRGGVGFDLSTLRPKGVSTANAAGTTDGIAVFMERFSRSCREVAQGGRRGALMQTISCAHPQVETFINIKRDLKSVTGANISVRITDEFMNAVENDQEFTLQWPVDVSLEDAKITKLVKAREIWEQIVDAAWTSAEPGVLFWDTILNKSMSDVYADKGFKTISTNPCAEITLSQNDACRLVVVNITKFVNSSFTNKAKFDHERFSLVTRKAQRLMDDLVDLEIEAIDKIIEKIETDPEPQTIKYTELELWKNIKNSNIKGRRTGLGLTGVGDAVAMLNMRYGSEDSIEFVNDVYRTLAISSHVESINLAKERGAFLVCEPKRYDKSHPFLEALESHLDDVIKRDLRQYGRRNIALTTTAPAGSVSILTQTTSGIEPVYQLTYKRRRKATSADGDRKHDFVDAMGDGWYEYEVMHPGLSKWMSVTGNTDIEKSPYWKATSNDIDWLTSVDLQAAAQNWIEHAISKTINLPADVTKETVSNLYFHAWKSGCKGVTIYRDGSRTGVLVNNENSEADVIQIQDKQPGAIVYSHAPKRPESLQCDIHRATIKGEKFAIIVGLLNNKPFECFAGLEENVDLPRKARGGELIKNGKENGMTTYNLKIPVGNDDEITLKHITKLFDNPLYGTHTRMISLALRHGVPVTYVCEQLKRDKTSDITSFSAVIARVLSKHYIDDEEEIKELCSECGVASLVHSEGCLLCKSCGYSKCG